MELIQIEKNKCCCGQYILDDGEDIIHNNRRHQVFGPDGNFCGSVKSHTISDLTRQLAEAKAQLVTANSLCLESMQKLNLEIARLRKALEYVEKELRYIPENIPLHFLNLISKINSALAQVK